MYVCGASSVRRACQQHQLDIVDLLYFIFSRRISIGTKQNSQPRSILFFGSYSLTHWVIPTLFVVDVSFRAIWFSTEFFPSAFFVVFVAGCPNERWIFSPSVLYLRSIWHLLGRNKTIHGNTRKRNGKVIKNIPSCASISIFLPMLALAIVCSVRHRHMDTRTRIVYSVCNSMLSWSSITLFFCGV